MQIAVEEGNNRAVDILLKYESMQNGLLLNKVKNIIDKIVPQTNFLIYAKSMPIQNVMMQDKTILKVPTFYSHSKKIVKI